MNRSRVSAPVSVALATLLAFSSGLAGGRPALAAEPAQESARKPAQKSAESVVVTGQGEVFGDPDLLSAHFAVETTGATVDDAVVRANTALTRMRDTLVRDGLARTDLQTSNAGIGSTRNDGGKITGYTVHQGLTAKIRNLPRAGALLSAAVAAGGDAARLNGVSFAVEDDAALLTEARKKAFADARAKAGLYAGEAGRSLGRVLKVSETGPGDGGSGGGDRMHAADSTTMPIEPGRQRLTVTVTVEWALAK
jgi:uncharacterized protein YggE